MLPPCAAQRTAEINDAQTSLVLIRNRPKDRHQWPIHFGRIKRPAVPLPRGHPIPHFPRRGQDPSEHCRIFIALGSSASFSPRYIVTVKPSPCTPVAKLRQKCFGQNNGRDFFEQ